MNAIGKTLVILNFLFAVIVGLLLVADVALRNQWKEAYYALLREVKVQEAGIKGGYETSRGLGNAIVAKEKEFAELKQDFADKIELAKAREDKYLVEIGDLNGQLKNRDLTITQSQELTKRLNDQIALLNKTIDDRAAAIVKLEQDVKVLRNTATDLEQKYRTSIGQNDNLLAQIQEFKKALDRKDVGTPTSDSIYIRNPNEPNPPTVKVDGKIMKVDSDLVQISLGTDQGVNKNHTLDVFRYSPEVKYLGMVRVIEANHHQSIARLIPSGNAAFRPQLKEGDLVTSKIK